MFAALYRWFLFKLYVSFYYFIRFSWIAKENIPLLNAVYLDFG